MQKIKIRLIGDERIGKIWLHFERRQNRIKIDREKRTQSQLKFCMKIMKIFSNGQKTWKTLSEMAEIDRLSLYDTSVGKSMLKMYFWLILQKWLVQRLSRTFFIISWKFSTLEKNGHFVVFLLYIGNALMDFCVCSQWNTPQNKPPNTRLRIASQYP